MRRIVVALSAAFIAGTALPVVALAQQTTAPPSRLVVGQPLLLATAEQVAQQPTAAAPAPPPEDHWHFDISPRVWIRTNNVVSGSVSRCGTGFFTIQQFCSRSADALSFVMVGASVTLEPPRLQHLAHPTDIVVTIYGGPSQQLTSQQVIFPAEPVPVAFGTQFVSVDRGSRIDSEVLARTAIDPSGLVRLVYGLRWLRNDDTVTTNELTPLYKQLPKVSSETDSLIGEGGVQFAVPIGESRHTLFGGVILGVGNSLAVRSSAEGFMDANVGYAYSLSARVQPYLRYRFQVFAPFAGGAFTTNLEVVHGPEVGLTLRF